MVYMYITNIEEKTKNKMSFLLFFFFLETCGLPLLIALCLANDDSLLCRVLLILLFCQWCVQIHVYSNLFNMITNVSFGCTLMAFKK